MGRCSVKKCVNRNGKTSTDISFHRFPSDKAAKKKWILSTGRKNWEPPKSAVLCSRHFQPYCFVFTTNRKSLIPSALPTEFLNLRPSIMQIEAETSAKGQEYNKENAEPLLRPSIMQIEAKTSAKSQKYNKENAEPLLRPSIMQNEVEINNEKLNIKLDKLKAVADRRRRKVRALEQSRRRLVKRVAELENIVAELKAKMFINSEQADILSNIETENREFLKRYILKRHVNTPKQYSSPLRKFALSLHFISPKAYCFVRDQFDTCLPHPKTLYNWFKVLDCEPGFTREAFDAIKSLVKASSKKILCALSFDEMSIRKHLQWDGKRTVGYVDGGVNIDSDSLAIAKDALVFLVTGLNGRWKLPVGYFLTDGIGGEQKSGLVKSCVNLLTDCGVKVVSLTFDGCPANFAMASLLGASFQDKDIIDTTIKVDSNEVVIFPDPCHMLKLVRNTLSDKKHITNGKGEVISWEFIGNLHELQETEGLHLANKLRRVHVQYKKQVMKVKLASQTFSNSVANALLFCKDYPLEEFLDAGPTAEFVKIFNDVFDILNTRQLFAYGFKKPLCKQNYIQVCEFIDKFVEYVRGLKLNRVPIIQSGRKTGFLGLIYCLYSLKKIFLTFIDVPDAPLNYLCTYKMSQDHLEIFFGAIRSKGGFNNNPTTMQFKSAYKSLLVHGELNNLHRVGNALTLDDIKILNLNKADYTRKINITSNTTDSREEVDIIAPIDVPESHDYLSLITELSQFSKEVVAYIAGFIIKKMKKQLKCDQCISSLISPDKNNSRLIAIKDVGGLHYPSRDMYDVCLYTEKIIKGILNTEGASYFSNKKNMPQIIYQVFKHCVNKNIFSQLNAHLLDQDPIDNHYSLLIKSIALRYLEVRIHHINKSINMNVEKVRNHLNKIILFKGQ